MKTEKEAPGRDASFFLPEGRRKSMNKILEKRELNASTVLLEQQAGEI